MIFCLSSLAQTEENSPCPSLEIYGPSGIVKDGDTITYTASLSMEPENFRVRYEWTVENGEIIRGQGTTSITIQPRSENVIATVEVYGLPENCGILTATETALCTLTDPEPEKIEEFVYSDSPTDREFLYTFAQILKEEPNATGYILIGSETGLTKKNFDKRVKTVRDFLVKNNAVEPDRIIVVNVGETKNLIQLWLVPPGAIPPTP